MIHITSRHFRETESAFLFELTPDLGWGYGLTRLLPGTKGGKAPSPMLERDPTLWFCQGRYCTKYVLLLLERQ
jgi:hypothetical protein